MRGQSGFFDIDERPKDLSAKGDDLERLKGLVDFEMFRPALRQAVPRSDRGEGGRPPFDHVLMFKVLVLQSMHSLSDERCEYLIKDRLSFMRFLGLGLADTVPDANTIWTFRKALTRATIEGEPAVAHLFKRFDAAVKACGYLAMGGQIVDATIVAAPKQRNTIAEKTAIKDGRIPEDWKAKPAKLAQKSLPWGLTRGIVMPAGRSNTPRPSPAKMGRNWTARRWSTSPSRPSATRTTSASIGATGSFAPGLSVMRRRGARRRQARRPCSIAGTPQATCGRSWPGATPSGA